MSKSKIQGLGGIGGNGTAARVAPPVPPRINTQSPNIFARRSIKPDTIGLAISPESNQPIESPEQRHSSKLLPDKPILTLMVPGTSQGSGPFKFSKQSSGIIRQSTATQFEEDFDSADTAVAGEENWESKPSGQILNNKTGKWSNIRTIPSSIIGAATTRDTPQGVIFPSDWKPPNPSATKPTSGLEIKPLALGRGTGSFSQPRPIQTDNLPQTPQKAHLAVPGQNYRPITTLSSVYSTSTHSSLPPLESGRNSRTSRSKSYKQIGPYDAHASSGSFTSFETNDSITSPQEPEPKAAGADLSPVVESPASGKSPVSYPKIPGRLSRDHIRMVPPPLQPDFSAAFSSQSGMKPWKVAELNAQRERERQAQQQVQPRKQLPPQDQGYERQLRQYIAPSAAYNTLPSQNQNNPLFHQNLGPQRPGLQVQHQLNNSRTSSMVSQSSNSSSLLAKRRGEQKAQALKLKTEDDRRGQQAKWRVLKDGDIQKAKSPNWRPQLAGNNGNVETERIELPSSPGWLPRLTPTRRGNELFLSVA
jgi:hypothetical protein